MERERAIDLACSHELRTFVAIVDKIIKNTQDQATALLIVSLSLFLDR